MGAGAQFELMKSMTKIQTEPVGKTSGNPTKILKTNSRNMSGARKLFVETPVIDNNTNLFFVGLWNHEKRTAIFDWIAIGKRSKNPKFDKIIQSLLGLFSKMDRTRNCTDHYWF